MECLTGSCRSGLFSRVRRCIDLQPLSGLMVSVSMPVSRQGCHPCQAKLPPATSSEDEHSFRLSANTRASSMRPLPGYGRARCSQARNPRSRDAESAVCRSLSTTIHPPKPRARTGGRAWPGSSCTTRSNQQPGTPVNPWQYGPTAVRIPAQRSDTPGISQWNAPSRRCRKRHFLRRWCNEQIPTPSPAEPETGSAPFEL